MSQKIKNKRGLRSKRAKRTAEKLPKFTLRQHFKELRKRLLICFISFILISVVAFVYAEDIYTFLARPLMHSLKYRSHTNSQFIFINLTECFLTYIKLSFFIGLLFVIPIFILQLYLFISKGLYLREKSRVLPYVILSIPLFFLGCGLAYTYALPLTCKFFLSFEGMIKTSDMSLPIVFQARISEYLDLVIELIIGFGLALQLPIIIILLNKASLISRASLVRGRRYAIVIIFILAAIFTPPDVVSQITLAVPMVLLYELAILFCNKDK